MALHLDHVWSQLSPDERRSARVETTLDLPLQADDDRGSTEHELLGYLALEDNDEARAAREADAALGATGVADPEGKRRPPVAGA